MKIYIMSIFGAGGNQRGSSYDGANGVCVYNSLKVTIKTAREEIKRRYKNFLKGNTACANEIRFYCNIVCIDTDKGKAKSHMFKVNPKELK